MLCSVEVLADICFARGTEVLVIYNLGQAYCILFPYLKAVDQPTANT